MPCFFAAADGGDQFLPLLALALLLTVGLALVLRRFRFPALPGYFLCGFLLARSGLVELSGAAPAAILLRQMSEVGIVLLMFSIGIECSAHELKALRKRGLSVGLWQMALTTAVVAAVFLIWRSPVEALLMGFILALSSTAVGVKLFEDHGIPGHPGARVALGIALVQDVLVILLLMLLPALTGTGGAFPMAKAAALLALEGVAFVVCAGVLSRYGIPQLLRTVSRTRSRELFTLTVLALCAGIASLGQWLGLGVTLGAFGAGVAVSGSVYSHRILADAAPFRDFFLTVFFLSVGALVDLTVLARHWLVLLAATISLLAVKPLLIVLAGRLARTPRADALMAGLALAGVGEFAIVLSQRAADRGLVSYDIAQMVLALAALTLSFSPLVMKLLLPRAERAATARPPVPVKHRAASVARKVKDMQNHVILCGYGTVGQMLHKGLMRFGIPVVIIELNSDTVAALLKKGHPVLFADIAQADTLELAGVSRARMIIVSFPHAEIARAAVTIARERNPEIATLCRARFPAEAAMLRAIAPDSVVHDEFEAGIKMLRLCTRVFDKDESDLVPRSWIDT